MTYCVSYFHKHNEISEDDFILSAEPGDMLLIRYNGNINIFQEIFTGGYYHHAALITKKHRTTGDV